MKIVRMTAEHVLSVQLQPAQAFAVPLIDAEHAEALAEAAGVAWTALDDNATPIACAGIVELHPHRGMAWALLSEQALREFKLIHRVVRDVVTAAPWRRIEMTVDAKHDRAMEWAKRLGFEREGLMRAYAPDGRDCYLYAKVK